MFRDLDEIPLVAPYRYRAAYHCCPIASPLAAKPRLDAYFFQPEYPGRRARVAHRAGSDSAIVYVKIRIDRFYLGLRIERAGTFCVRSLAPPWRCYFRRVAWSGGPSIATGRRFSFRTVGTSSALRYAFSSN